MCLSKLAKFKPCEVGYKILREDNGGNLTGEYYGDAIRQRDIWLNEKDFRDYEDRRGTAISKHRVPYPFGWHVFHTKQAAFDWNPCTSIHRVCAKVEAKDPVAVGYQKGKRVTVAKQIKIIGIVKEAK